MMNISEWLMVIGPLIAMVGAGILAVDAVRSPANWYQRVFFPRGWVKAIMETHESVLKSIQSLSSPPYTPETLKRLEEEAVSKLQERLSQAKKERDTIELEECFKSQKRALRGFLLIAIGSFLQALSAGVNQQF